MQFKTTFLTTVLLASTGVLANTRPVDTLPDNSVALGGECAKDSQCKGGAQCYATNSMLIPRCGNFQAGCKSDAQCAFNKCKNNFCAGAQLSNAPTSATITATGTGSTTTTASTTGAAGSASASSSGTASKPTGAGNSTSSSGSGGAGSQPLTAGASMAVVDQGVAVVAAAAVFNIYAWVL